MTMPDDAEKDVWGKFSVPPPEEGSCPEEIEFAAYLEGSMTEKGVSRMEEHLAACTRCRSIVREMIDDSGRFTSEMPTELSSRIKALFVFGEGVGVDPGGVTATGTLHFPGFRGMDWMSAVAACLVLGFVGYRMGGGMVLDESEMEQKALSGMVPGMSMLKMSGGIDGGER